MTAPTLRERAWSALDYHQIILTNRNPADEKRTREHAEAIAIRNEVGAALERLEMLERAVVDSHLRMPPRVVAVPDRPGTTPAIRYIDEEIDTGAEKVRLERRTEAMADRMYADDVDRRGLSAAHTLRFYLNTARAELGLTPKE